MTERAYRAAFSQYVEELNLAAHQMTPEVLVHQYDGLPFREASARFERDMHAAMLDDLNRHGLGAVDAIGFPKAVEESAKLFTVDNPYAINFAAQHAAEMVEVASTATRMAIADTIREGFTSHRTYADIARNIRGYTDKKGIVHRGIVGNTLRDAAAVNRNYAQQRLMGWSPLEAQKIASRHSHKLLMNRGKRIAVTETAFATENGKLASWRTMQDQGVISPATVRVWITANDERVCPICAPMHRESVSLNEPFSNGQMGPPAHPECHCGVVVRVVVPGMTANRQIPKQPSQRTLDRNLERNRQYRNAQRRKFNRTYRPGKKR